MAAGDERAAPPWRGRSSATARLLVFRNGRRREPAAPRRRRARRPSPGGRRAPARRAAGAGLRPLPHGRLRRRAAGLRRGAGAAGAPAARPRRGRLPGQAAAGPAGQRVRRPQRRRQRRLRGAAHAGRRRWRGRLLDGPEVARALVNLADAWWGCWEYGRALRTYAEALAAIRPPPTPAGRHVNVVGQGIVLGSIGRYEEAARLLAEGAGASAAASGTRGSPLRPGATSGRCARARATCDAALDASREAVALAERRRASGIPSRWPGRTCCGRRRCAPPAVPGRAPRIEAALGGGPAARPPRAAVHLAWVRLLHRTADPTRARRPPRRRPGGGGPHGSPAGGPGQGELGAARAPAPRQTLRERRPAHRTRGRAGGARRGGGRGRSAPSIRRTGRSSEPATAAGTYRCHALDRAAGAEARR